MLDVSFEIRKIRENLRKEVKYLESNIIINILRNEARQIRNSSTCELIALLTQSLKFRYTDLCFKQFLMSMQRGLR